jgi:hypothetical protein
MEDFQKCPAPKNLDFMGEGGEGSLKLLLKAIGLLDKAIIYGAFLCGIEYHSCHILQIPYIRAYIAFIGL